MTIQLLLVTLMIFPFPEVANNLQLHSFYVVIANFCLIHLGDFVCDPQLPILARILWPQQLLRSKIINKDSLCS